jgi:hypothetical protein
MYLVVPQQDQQQPQGSYNCNHDESLGSMKHHEVGSDNASEVSDTSTCTNPSSPTSSYNSCCKQQQPQLEEGESSTPQTPPTVTTSQDFQDNTHSVNDVESDIYLPMADSSIPSTTSATTDGAAPAVAKAELEKETKHKKKHSVGFEPLSTLYVFDDDASGKEDKDYYDIDNTWYSSHELKSFRADAFLTVNWMVMKGINPITANKAATPPENNEHYCYYSNKYGYDRQRELQTIAPRKGQFEFCERGIECRTPLGRVIKNKRRLDAMRVVILYQQMQKQHRRERRRERRRQKQNQYQEGDDISNSSKKNKAKKTSSNNTMMIRRHTPSPEAVRKIEADIDADALANVYGSYCKESASEAVTRGLADATAAGIPTSPKSTSSSPTSTGEEATLLSHPYDRTTTKSTNCQNTVKFECPSLCDEDDDDLFMDKITSVSFADQDENDDNVDEECSTTSSISSSTSCASPPRGDTSLTSVTSMSLEDLTESNKHGDEERLNHSHPVVEVELIEGNDDQPHRIIYCYEQQQKQKQKENLRRKSWSHPELKSPISCSSLPEPSSQLEVSASPVSAHGASAMSSSFSSLELGGLFFGAVTGLDWW